MGAKSRRKGNRGENEVRQLAAAHGITTDRTRSGDGQPLADVVGIPGCTVEVKRHKRITTGDVRGWLAQLNENTPRDTWPVLAHRADRQDWLASLSLADWLDLTCATINVPRAAGSETVTVPLPVLFELVNARQAA